MIPLNIVADENIPRVEETFACLGNVVKVNGRQLAKQQLLEADILLVRSVTNVNEALLAGTPVRFVATATIGIDHLDTAYLDANGISWASAPGSNADSVVDYVISSLCRLEGVLEQLLVDGVVGIIGMGNVGSRLYQRLSTLGIDCCAYDPLLAPTSYPVLTDLDTVLAADVICMHVPLTTTGDYPTYHLLNKQRILRLKPGVVIINAGRGATLDNVGLLEVLDRRDDPCVVLDVWENEPNIDIQLMKRIDISTPHVAGYSLDGKLAGTAMIYQACCQFLGVEAVVSQRPKEDLFITVTEKHNVVAAMKEAVLLCYDVADDDQRLRGALLHSSDEQRSVQFDQLRKNYPERREFSHCRITNTAELDSEVVDGLVALGFC